MKTIYKYPMPITDHPVVELPKGAQVLTFQVQHGEPHIWALVDPKAKFEKRYFRVAGTGHEIAEDMGVEYRYIGTIQLEGGALIFHLFEQL